MERFGCHKFKNKHSGEIVEFHRGKSGKHGHLAHDHYHRPNPARTGYMDWYLDAKRNPVSKNSDASHLYPTDTNNEMFNRKQSGYQHHFITSISNYLDYFHDGSVLDIKHSDHFIELTMISVEMDKEDIVDDILLSKDEHIQGKLHIEGVKSVKIDGIPIHGKLEQAHDDGGIFSIQLTEHSVKLEIMWVNFPPKNENEQHSVIEIEAGKIWWENIPDLNRNRHF